MMKTLAVLVDWQLRSLVSRVAPCRWACHALRFVLRITERTREGRIRQDKRYYHEHV
jgi:hypothetical protein